jgi:HEAT repeat protein
MAVSIPKPRAKSEKWVHRATLWGATDSERELIAGIQATDSVESLKQTLQRTEAEIDSSDDKPPTKVDRADRLYYFTCYRLAELGTDQSRQALAELLGSGRTPLRRAACRRMTDCPSDFATPHLLAALEDSDSRVRTYAAGGLWKHGYSEAIPKLLSLLDSADWYERNQVAWILASFGDASLKPALRRARRREWRRPWRFLMMPRRVRDKPSSRARQPAPS